MMRYLALSVSILTFMAMDQLSAAAPRGPSPDGQTPAASVRSANHAALREPSIAGYINAVQVYPYGEGVLYRLYAAPERVTDIALQPGETVTAVAAGDTVRWTIGDTSSGNGDTRRTHILVKPFAAEVGFENLPGNPRNLSVPLV